jgi:phospholipase C
VLERIEHWVVLMFENRSFDSLLGHLPHIPAEDGLRGREIRLPSPAGEVLVQAVDDPTAPLPDPGEGYGNVNVQLWGRYLPTENAGRSPYPLFPEPMVAPFNLPEDAGTPTMDGFAVDYFHNFRWQKKRKPTLAEVAQIGHVMSPRTAPVINTLAQEYAVFTRWFCEAPTCTLPNRSLFLAGTSLGKVDNDDIVSYAWDQRVPTLFDLLTDAGLDWRAYYDESQVVPACAINLGGLHEVGRWRAHAAHRERFFADAAAGTLPTFSWVEPKLLFGPLDDYHPPTDVRSGEQLLAEVYDAVRSSPQWESTALVVLFDEHGGCYDHVPPPSAPPPDDHEGAEGFGFDRLGVRVPALVISPYTEHGMVVTDTFHSCSVLRTLRERFDLGPALSRRDAVAPLLDVAFNRSDPRTDRPDVRARPYEEVAPTKAERRAALGDAPDTAFLVAERERVAKSDLAAEERRLAAGISQIGAATLRNAARLLQHDPDRVPTEVAAAKAYLAEHLHEGGRLRARLRP